MEHARETKTKETLIEAAKEIFQQKGYQKTRVSDIVQKAGVAQGTFYLYFKSKEQIFRDICSEFMERISFLFIEHGEHLFDGESADEIKGNVALMVRSLFRIYKENLIVAELLFREGIGNGGLFKEIYEDLLFHFQKLIQEQIEIGIQKGIIATEDPEAASIFLFGFFERGLFYFFLVKKDLNIDALESKIISFIFNGLSFDYHWRANRISSN